MKYLLVPFIAFGISSAAFATDYPPCSKTVQDECISTPTAHHMMKTSKKPVRHAALHHSASGKMEKSAKS